MIEWNEVINKYIPHKFAPSILREILRIFYIKECFISSDFELPSLNFSRKIVLRDLVNAYRFPKKTIRMTLFVPGEIIYAMNLYPFCLEIGSSLFSKVGLTQSALLAAESQGVPNDSCSFHRAAMGYMYKNFYPMSSCQATTTSLCDNNTKTISIAESLSKDETTVLDVPYDYTDESVAFLATQLEEFAGRLEKTFSIKMDKNALRKSIECSNRTREYMIEVNRLREHPASPLSGSDALGLIVNSHLLCGSKDGEVFYKMLVDDLKERIETAERNKTHQVDKIKILWLELKPYFDSDLLSNLEKEHDVKIVFEEINHVFWEEMDPDKPYESLARKMISNQNNGPLENRIEGMKELAKRYHVDAVIMFASWGCRRNGAAVPILKDEFNKEGIPMLTLYGDCIDDSAYTEGQFSTRVEGFIEMMRTKKKQQKQENQQAPVLV